MSKRYPGGIITKSPATPTGPFDTGTAPGIWTLEQQMQFKQQGVWPLAGNLAPYIEDVFSTYLWTGNGTLSIPIVNGIDLSGKGGMVWMKGRNTINYNYLYDTVRGVSSGLVSNTTNAAADYQALSAFNSNGFTDSFGFTPSETAVSWTFREQPKFFDVVTYTGNGTGERAIAHNLGSTPGCVIVKRTDSTAPWGVWHRGNGVSAVTYFELNSTAAGSTDASYTAFTSATTFTVDGLGPASTSLNTNGATYVAYLFAHDAGGFGLTGTDNVISCGSFTTDGSGLATVSLGYEPQWVMAKSTSGAGNWFMFDIMRGYTADTTSGTDARLLANTSAAELNNAPYGGPNATGFTGYIDASTTYIYIAIRRGPMKVPTVGTSVYNAITRTGTGAVAQVTGVGFTPDSVLVGTRGTATDKQWQDRLRGATQDLATNRTYGQVTHSDSLTSFNMDGCTLDADTSANTWNISGRTYVNWFLKRAPSVFDVVCYTGTGVATTFTHNLTVVPELMIVKKRSSANNWVVWQKDFGTGLYGLEEVYLNLTYSPPSSGGAFLNTPTSTVFSVSTYGATNGSGATYVAYLFATCAGVSKVGSYTGNGTTQTIDCGFGAGGARFVLIKRTDSTGDWYTYDTARGMTVLTDPYLLINDTAAEVATLGSVTTVSTGFALNSSILAAINISAGTYIFLAIA